MSNVLVDELAAIAPHIPAFDVDRTRESGRPGQPHAIRHDPAETLHGQVSHRPFGISEAHQLRAGMRCAWRTGAAAG
jgi:hypothetical protein